MITTESMKELYQHYIYDSAGNFNPNQTGYFFVKIDSEYVILFDCHPDIRSG